jgi:hypothetical protein
MAFLQLLISRSNISGSLHAIHAILLIIVNCDAVILRYSEAGPKYQVSPSTHSVYKA